MIRTDEADDQPATEWKFNKLLNFGKADNNRWQYLMEWGPPYQPTWQPATDLKGCDDAIWAFHDAHLKLPRPPS